MSRLGKKPIEIPEGVEVKLEDGVLKFKGKKGDLTLNVLPHIKAELKDNQLSFAVADDDKQAKINLGTIAALVRNCIVGVQDGYTKSLIIDGIGYKAVLEGKNLVLNVGFSHQVRFEPPEEVDVSVNKNTIKIEGIDKALVGQIAASIRKIKKPEPYKGKGIRYSDEVIRRKAGKKAIGTTAG